MTSTAPQDLVFDRALPGVFGAPDARLRASVVVPARNEARRLPALIGALAEQRDAHDQPLAPGTLDVLVLLNNCTDRSAEAVADAASRYPSLDVRAVSLTFPPEVACVGHARRVLLDAACARLHDVGRPEGAILSTDADTVPAPDWVAATLAELASGADAVGGRALLLREERAALAPGVRRLYLLDLAYRRAIEEVRGLYAPEAHDPIPRHHHHFGASLAVTAGVYAAVGGQPVATTSEDVALVHALVGGGYRLRHSPHVRVFTSARTSGRADGGLADAFGFWADVVRRGDEPRVEAASAAERRLAALGLYRAAHPDAPPPLALLVTPEAGGDVEGEPITRAIRGLRACIARLRPLPLTERLRHARCLPL
ncbi:glycosyltransferase [Rubricoccus marinus]|uniref:Glycosyltransferase 2-like domain-containing protein n=1 Tax=Rubricoccus marinus TaxID=716817 RepID=A0A259TXK0_9BACT|nr:glycosyltransferase family A protein [Rubricoccus marinus]OZC02503.1 hypothetical protein BSZ36_05640 [Rubricoccus marinus]